MAYLHNIWYVAAWGSDVERELLPRKILGQPVLLYRKENGEAVAIGDRCPHRFAPLHMGRLVGDRVECGYHGLQFYSSGICAANPHGNGAIPAAARVPAYPVHERDGLVWIWMGHPQRAAADMVPDFGYLADPGQRTVGGQVVQQANYQLIVDNLMDLTHVNYLHAPYQKNDDMLAARHDVVQTGNVLDSRRTMPCTTAPGSFRPFMADPDAPVEYWLNMRWHAPGACQLEIGVTPVGRPRSEGLRRMGTHIVTPETETASRYFYASSRNYRLDDPAADAETAQWQQTGFHEQDKPMIEAVQAMMGTPDLESLSPILLASDAAAMRVRRLLAGMIQAEQESVAATPAAASTVPPDQSSWGHRP